MKLSFARMVKVALLLVVIPLTLPVSVTPGFAREAPRVRLQGHVPAKAIAGAKWLGRHPASAEVPLLFSLPLRNRQELDDLLKRIYNPSDPLHGHYLTAQQFTDKFGPTQSDYDALIAYARGLGLTVTGTHSNRTLLSVSGSTAQVESAFGLHLHQYQGADGRTFHAPDNDPEVPDFIASRVSGVIGLDTAAVWHAHSHAIHASDQTLATPYQIGTGPGGGLTPNNIRAAYNLNTVAANGAGQTLAVFELDGYTASDIAAYCQYYGLPSVPLQNVLVDGFAGTAGTGAAEVTLDIELQIALAPGASKVMVYEGPNSNKGVLDTYNRIATDNVAKQISTSWGLNEGQSSATVISSENAIFQQMAAQGQSIYASSGDSGAYDNNTTLSVDDPASQPYMVGVGGTHLNVNSDGTFNRESTWNVNNTVSGGAGGGGVSFLWGIPSWQQNVATVASSVMRNVPDVSLNADPNTGYSVYFQGGWRIYGGTSCASPLWAAFTARVNQQRVANGLSTLGFANPVLYGIAAGTGYGTNFHDVADGTTNLYYPAVTGYDDATGWGSFNGANLFATLAPTSTVVATPTLPGVPTGLIAAAGNGSVALSWTASSGAATYNVYRGTSAGGEGVTPVKSGVSATSYTDSVANGVTYYYKVSATNSAGTSALSSEVSATPKAPLLAITGGPTVTVSGTSGQVQWTTNLASNTQIRIGTASTNLNTSATYASLVTSHVVKLSSLRHGTTYYYQVSSTVNGVTVSSAVKSFKD